MHESDSTLHIDNIAILIEGFDFDATDCQRHICLLA